MPVTTPTRPRRPRNVGAWVDRQDWTGDPRAIRELAATIEAHPRHFNMESWFGGTFDLSSDDIETDPEALTAARLLHDIAKGKDRPGACGTTACAAGWAIALHPVKARRIVNEGVVSDIPDVACALLGVQPDDAGPWIVLFGEVWLKHVAVASTLRYIADLIAAGRS